MHSFVTRTLFLVAFLPAVFGHATAEHIPALQWSTPGLISLHSVPLGNGTCAVNVWVDEHGDLLMYLARSDAWSENGRLEKIGRVRIALTPRIFSHSTRYLETLDLGNGMFVISARDGKDSTRITLRVDAHHPVVVAAVTGSRPMSARVSLERWRTVPRPLKHGEEIHSAYGLSDDDGPPVIVEPDTVMPHRERCIAWFHRNTRSVWADNLRLQDLDPATAGADPLLHRTFGGMIEGDGMVPFSDSVLTSRTGQRTFEIRITLHTRAADTGTRWSAETDSIATAFRKTDRRAAERQHRRWWTAFWERSWIELTSSDPTQAEATRIVTQGYRLQRYMLACAGRGPFPIKFNGSLFTVDTYDRPGPAGGLDADFRRWGGPYWFQNTRLAYWPMLASGDLDMMDPLFAMYLRALPLRQQATRRYYGHDGAYFPETMNFWGTYTNTNYGYGRDTLAPGLTVNRYIRYHWNGGLELAMMMLDRYAFRPDDAFARTTLVPLATEVLRFFRVHWPHTADGTIRFAPSQALETYQSGVQDPMPDVAGARVVAGRMLQLPERLTGPALRAAWSALLTELPPLPTRVVGKDTLLAPAALFGTTGNIENPELYAVFPYRIFGIERPGLAMARRTFFARPNKENGGWQQHGVQAAILGLADSAAALVADNFARHDTLCRFPAFWGPNYDWTPDQDHGSVAMLGLQAMLLQERDGAILIAPALPRSWNARFRLHASGGTVVEATVVGGRVTQCVVSPSARQRDTRLGR